MQNIKLTVIGYFLSILLTACGGGGNGTSTNNQQQTTDQAGQYDLAEYQFDQSLMTTGNNRSYTVSVYELLTGNLSITYTDSFEKISADTIVWTSNTLPASTYVITDSQINETVHSAYDAFRPSQRFVDIGTRYMDTTTDLPPFGQQNARCTVMAHHNSIDLSTLTGSFNLAMGIYEDVLEVNCLTSFVVQNDQLATHTNLTHYFAKGAGVVFISGTLLLFGDVYIIPEI